MRKSLFLKGFVAILTLLLGISINGCDLFLGEPYKLTVQVLDFDGEPLEGMRVNPTRQTETGETESDGKVFFSELQGSQEIEVIDPEREIWFPAKRVSSEDDGSTITIQAEYYLNWAEVQGKIIISEPEGNVIEYSVNVLDGNPYNDDPDTIESFGSDSGFYSQASGEEFEIEVMIKEDPETGEKNNQFFIVGTAIAEGEKYYQGIYGAESPRDFDDAKELELEDGDYYPGIEFYLFPSEE